MSSIDSFPAASSAELSLLVDVQAGPAAGTARIAVFGDLERASALPLERAVIHVLREQRPGHLELDLAGVSFVDIGGVRSLLRCRSDTQQLGCRLTLINVQPDVHRVLAIVDLLEPFNVARQTPGRSRSDYHRPTR